MSDLRSKVAFSLAVSQNADYFYDMIDEWETMEDWEQEAYEGDSVLALFWMMATRIDQLTERIEELEAQQ